MSKTSDSSSIFCRKRTLEPKTPSSFGGVSGSGLWRFSIARLSESEIKPYDFQLAGVAPDLASVPVWNFPIPEPDKGAGKAYALLREALAKTGKVGVAQFVGRALAKSRFIFRTVPR